MKRLKATKNGRETLQRGTAKFPCAGYYTNIEEHITGEIGWHWHDELEVFIVIGGSCTVTLGPENTVYPFAKGDGGVINSDIMHTIQISGGKGCRLISFVFQASLLSDGENGDIFLKYIAPFIRCRGLEMVSLRKDKEAEGHLIEQITHAYLSYVEKKYCFEMTIRNALSLLLTYLICQNQEQMKMPYCPISKEEERVRSMIHFIQQNYEKPITPRDIAASVAISQRACFRCFEKMIGESPMSYLTHRRIQAAMEMLLSAQQSITEISFTCGFNSSSYFTKVFRDYTGKSPREYQKLNLPFTKPGSHLFE